MAMVNIVPPFLSKVQIAVRVCLANSIVLPWTFLQVNRTSYKYNQLWKEIVQGVHENIQFNTGLQCSPASYDFHEATAYISMAMTNGIKGDEQQDIMEAINFFKMRFFSISIKHNNKCDSCRLLASANALKTPPNAFALMMAAAKDAAAKDVPQISSDPKTSFDELKNAILRYFQEKNCVFPTKFGNQATIFLSRLSDLLYYLDGHYSKIECKTTNACMFPTVYSVGSSCTLLKQLASKIYTNGLKKEYPLGPMCHQ